MYLPFLKKGLARNGMFAMGQGVVVAISLFLSYRILIADVGMAQMGLWSLLVAFGSLGRVMDVSGTGALGRFIAISGKDEDCREQRDIVYTVLLTSLGINLFLGIAMYLLAPLILPDVIDTDDLMLASSLVPWVIATFVLGAIANGISGGIDGLQRADKRALVVSAAAALFLWASWVMVPRLGLIGFALAQVIQQLAIIGVGWCLLRRYIPGLGWMPLGWRAETFRNTTIYSIKLNAIGVMGILFEPLAKAAFNHAGGTVSVAVYELASRMVTQVRALVIAASVPMVPAMAATDGKKDPRFLNLLARTMKLASWAALLVAVLSLLGAPIMSLVVLGDLSEGMLKMNAILTLGWSANIFALPLYLAGQAFGVLRWNFASHAVIALVLILSLLILVPVFSTSGVVVGIVGGLAAGTLITMIGNASSFSCYEVLRNSFRNILLSSCCIVALCAGAWLLA